MNKWPLLVWNKNVSDTELEKFKNNIQTKYSKKFDSYWDFHKWTVDNLDEFFAETWNYFQIISSVNFDKVLFKFGTGLLDYTWFTGAYFNYAENLLKYRDDTLALMYTDETEITKAITFKMLYEKVKLFTAAFRKNGMKKGDVLACYLSNKMEAVFAMLAAASIGAIWCGYPPFYGAKAATFVFNSVKAKFLISEDMFELSGKKHDMLNNLSLISKAVSSLEKVLILKCNTFTSLDDIASVKNSCFLSNFLEEGKLPNGQVPDLIFEQCSTNHPLFITYTSGTTGDPKGAVHSSQVLITQLVDAGFHFNLKKGDVLMNIVEAGYSDWIFFIPTLALGVTVSLYNCDLVYVRSDGSTFWDIIAQQKVTFTYLVTGLMDNMEKSEIVPRSNSNLENLKIISLGGSPLKRNNYKYIFEKIKRDVYVGNLYGSSESLGLFGGFDLNSPSYAEEVQVPALGKKVECYDKDGNSIIGERGELVLTNPSPSFPLYLWNDANNEKINSIYLNRYQGAWLVNDECIINPITKGIIIIGRSDNAIHQKGDIFGPDDIYTAIHDIDEIRDYICVGQKNSIGLMRAVLFVQLKKGYVLNSMLKTKIETAVSKNFSPQAVPEVILEAKEIPYSCYGKRMENLVRKILATNQIPTVTNIKNPNALLNFYNIPEILNYNEQ